MPSPGRDLREVAEQPLLQLTLAMDRNRNLIDAPALFIDVMAPAHPEEPPAVALETFGEFSARQLALDRNFDNFIVRLELFKLDT